MLPACFCDVARAGHNVILHMCESAQVYVRLDRRSLKNKTHMDKINKFLRRPGRLSRPTRTGHGRRTLGSLVQRYLVVVAHCYFSIVTIFFVYMCKTLVFTFLGSSPFFVTKLIEQHSESRTCSSTFLEEVAEEEPSVEKWPWSADFGKSGATISCHCRSLLFFYPNDFHCMICANRLFSPLG